MERDYISGILSNFLITELSVSMDPRLFQVIGISTSKRLLVYIYIYTGFRDCAFLRYGTEMHRRETSNMYKGFDISLLVSVWKVRRKCAFEARWTLKRYFIRIIFDTNVVNCRKIDVCCERRSRRRLVKLARRKGEGERWRVRIKNAEERTWADRNWKISLRRSYTCAIPFRSHQTLSCSLPS